MTTQLTLPEPSAPAYAPGALNRDPGPTYWAVRTSKDVDMTRLVAATRAEHPNARLFAHADTAREHGLEPMRHVRPEEVWILDSEGAK